MTPMFTSLFETGSKEKIEEVFRKFLPENHSAYARPFCSKDYGENFYLEGGFGIFSPDGECMGGFKSMWWLRRDAAKHGVKVYSVH